MHTFAIIGFIWFFFVFVLIGVLYFWPLGVQRFLRRHALSKIADKRILERPEGKLTYFEAGEGPTVVLLHGAGDHAGSWVDVARALVPRFHLIMPDLPDHGSSEFKGDSLNLGDVFSGLEDLLENGQEGKRVTLMGNSMGGWIALLFALRYPDRVDALILEDSGGIRKESETPNLIPATVDEARALLKATRGPDDPEVPKFVLRDLIQLAKNGPIAKLAHADPEPYFLDDKLFTLNLPVFILWGEDDGLLPPEYGRSLAEKIAGAKLHFIPRCGHIPHLEKPKEVISLLQEFLEQLQKTEPQMDTNRHG